jgi:hypothetical protein
MRQYLGVRPLRGVGAVRERRLPVRLDLPVQEDHLAQEDLRR